jgi:Retrotransposon gag protein
MIPAGNPLSMLSSIPVFTGNGPDHEQGARWIEYVEEIATLCGWSDVFKLKVARLRLADDADLWDKGMRNEIHDWTSFVHHFLDTFSPKEEVLYQRLATCTQYPNETVRQYADRFRALCCMLGVDFSRDRSMLHTFMAGLNRHIYNRLMLMCPNSVHEAIEKACYLDECGTD